MSTDPFTAGELVAAYDGREADGLAIAREAAAQFQGILRARLLDDARALGLNVEAIARELDGNAPVAAPAKPSRTPKDRLPAPTDDVEFIKLLDAELTKGPASALGLAKRFTGASKDRVVNVLAGAGVARYVLHGRTWTKVST